MKHRQSDQTINKNQVLQWINSTLNGNQTKIQSLGNGIVYCLLMNHHYPNSIPHNKIVMMPRNSMDNKANLRKVQEALNLQNIKSINFDVCMSLFKIFRVSEMSYLDNWQLISKFYRHFQELSKNKANESEMYNHQSQSQQLTNTSQNQTIQQNNLIQQSQINFTLPKQGLKTPDFTTGLLTPMKGLKYFEQNTKLRYEALKLMEQIKSIVKSETQNDKIKVKNLKRMLGLIEQESQEQELQMKELFSDCNKKQEIITID